MSSSPLEEDFDSRGASTSSRPTSQEADLSFVTVSSGEPPAYHDFDSSSFVTVDSERRNSFETASENLTCDESEIGDVENGRKLTKRERKKQVTLCDNGRLKKLARYLLLTYLHRR